MLKLFTYPQVEEMPAVGKFYNIRQKQPGLNARPGFTISKTVNPQNDEQSPDVMPDPGIYEFK